MSILTDSRLPETLPSGEVIFDPTDYATWASLSTFRPLFGAGSAFSKNSFVVDTHNV